MAFFLGEIPDFAKKFCQEMCWLMEKKVFKVKFYQIFKSRSTKYSSHDSFRGETLRKIVAKCGEISLRNFFFFMLFHHEIDSLFFAFFLPEARNLFVFSLR